MKTTFAAAIALLSLSCSKSTAIPTGTEEPLRPATEREVYGLPLHIQAFLEPEHAPSAPARDWRGYATMKLHAPVDGERPIVDIEFTNGFADLASGCWAAASAPFLYSPETGEFNVIFALGEEHAPTLLRLQGDLLVDRAGDIIASGRWQVEPSSLCGPNDFIWGVQGLWDNEIGLLPVPIQGGSTVEPAPVATFFLESIPVNGEDPILITTQILRR